MIKDKILLLKHSLFIITTTSKTSDMLGEYFMCYMPEILQLLLLDSRLDLSIN